MMTMTPWHDGLQAAAVSPSPGLAPVKPDRMTDCDTHWLVTPDGTRLRAAFWPGPGGTALLLNGRTEFIEKHLETVADLRARGYAVWSLDWRGQGRSTRPLRDPLRNHVASFDQHLADLDLLIDTLIRPQALTVLGISMGGHLALRLMAARPGLVGRAVLVAPMIDLPWPRFWTQQRARIATALLGRVPGVGGRFAPGTRRLPDPARPFAGNPLTADPQRFAQDLDWLRTPGLSVGGATWGWLRAAAQSFAILHRPGFAERIGAPVLLLLAGQDRIVDSAAARRFGQRLPAGEVLELPDALHEILREHDAIRAQAWAAIDRFLDQAGSV